jgi:predicted DNA binding CopG/RHH family protein
MMIMSKEPTVGTFLDREEEELFRAMESDAHVFGKCALTPERKTELQKAARQTLKDERVQITLRVSKHNLSKLKARAMLEGMPYKTLINSILHMSVN